MLLNIANIALMLSAAAGVVGRPLDHVTVVGYAFLLALPDAHTNSS